MRYYIFVFTILILFFGACSEGKPDSNNSEITGNNDFMIKLYKDIDGQLHYWETWNSNDRTAIIHWGIVGERGDDKKITSSSFSELEKDVQKEIDEKIKEGYSEWNEDKIIFLDIEYIIEGFGTDADLDKRHRLEDRLNETLGWTGLGHVDGGSIGSGTMEVGCMVVDFDIAKKVIEEDLKGTEFEDYSRFIKLE